MLKFPQLVHFAEDVEVAFSYDDNPRLFTFKTSLRELETWSDKPWDGKKKKLPSNLHKIAHVLDVIAALPSHYEVDLPLLSHLAIRQNGIIDN